MTGDQPRRALPPWWAVLLVAVGVVAVAFAIGRFSTFGQTPSTPLSTSAEAGFARDMQVHHGQAVEMAMQTYRTTDDPGIRVLAYDIATTQSAQRGEFYDWLVKWNLPQAGGPLMAWMAGTDHAHGGAGETATDAELMTQMGMASAAEMQQLQQATGTAGDCLFLELMIRHHEGALPMAQALIDLGSEPRALQVARGVLATQSAEIDLMRSLQSQLSCAG
ncbi:DUF305 domain-containing protein [Microbacterium sp. W1N]|uniref:DUF305 domain-containing protein n=1 Tax=Microbacterium festucae TaxID=2977531 RepID=UPI0021BE0E4D|nr:DUF305 domain-containing protein [Microbacterium festucae]MCT9820885.1 DUF305 domain-containing protein [Microbacterium festucae]